MRNPLSVLALIVGAAGLGVGGYALTEKRSDPTDVSERIAALEEHVQRLERTLDRQAEREPRGPALAGSFELPATSPEAVDADGTEAVAGERTDEAGSPTASADVTTDELQSIVDKAVAKKAEQMRQMANKKPSIDVFSKTLQLTDAQRAAAEEEIVRGQREIRELLETPADDGTVFLDELVDIMAEGMAKPGQPVHTRQRGAKLFGRLMSENVPGTDETYAARAEKVKDSVRATFKRTWTAEQYATFEQWQMDPTEVQGIENSAYKDLQARIVERARELGADIPGNDE